MRFAAIFVPDFPVQAVVRTEPELRTQAVAVMEGAPPLLYVAACNECARIAGVEMGMTKLEAEGRLSSRNPGPVSLPPHPAKQDRLGRDPGPGCAGWRIRRRSPVQEAAAHAALLDCAGAFSPQVEDNAAMPDLVVLDLSGLERLFGPPAKIARNLAQRASELGLEVNVAVAGNPETAAYGARGFAGVTVIASGEEAERLGVLPVEVLLGGDALVSGLPENKRGAEVLDTLTRWGVRTFRALAALPETAVKQRLGELGVRLQKLARGEGSRPLVPAKPPLKFEEAAELEPSVCLLEPLTFLLSHLLERLCTRLAARALATEEVKLVLSTQYSVGSSDTDENPPPRHRDTEKNPKIENRLVLSTQYSVGSSDTDENPPPRHRDTEKNPKIENRKSTIENEYVLHLPVPMLDAKVFLKLLQLELCGKPPGAPVEKIRLIAEPAHPRFVQGGLFLPAVPEPEKLEVMLARIHAVVSRQSPVISKHSAFSIQPSANIAASCESRVGGRESPPFNSQLATHNSTELPEADLQVGSPELLDTHRPDAFRMKKFLSGTGNSQLATRNSQLITRNFMAVRRFRPPLPARVEVRSGRPVRILVVSCRSSVASKHSAFSTQLSAKPAGGGRQSPSLADGHSLLANSQRPTTNDYRLTTNDPSGNWQPTTGERRLTYDCLWSAGPWRESGEWWTGQPWSREVWDIALCHEGQTAIYRIFRDRNRDQWFVEAMYD